MIKKTFFISLLSFLVFACASAPQEGEGIVEIAEETTVSQPSEESLAQETDVQVTLQASSADAYHILVDIPYLEGALIAENVLTSCTQLGRQFSNAVVKYAPKHKIDVVQVDGSLPAEGRSVALKILNVHSGGNAFLGHSKVVAVKAELMIDGVVVAQTTKTRNSSGGFWGGFKSSCDVLARTVNTLGSDIGDWLRNQ